MDKNFGPMCYFCGCIRITGFNVNGAVCPDCGRKHHYVSGGYIPEGFELKLVKSEEVHANEGCSPDSQGGDVSSD